MYKIILDPLNRIKYSSFYIKGLQDVFGIENITFSSKYFTDLQRSSDSNSFDHYMAFVLLNNITTVKIIIDFRDKITIKENAYKWCDLYAKININRRLTETELQKKLLSIPPGFGIKIWGFWKTIYLCVLNLLRCKFKPLISIKAHLIDYIVLLFRRTRIEYYYNSLEFDNKKSIQNNKQYVFFIATLWPHENCIVGTNLFRKKFIELCKTNPKINFEGGFYLLTSITQANEIKDLLFSKRYSINSYINKTRTSSFVFNTPAVFECHGWKLGEYLALGKAIISTPISNELPESLIHGKHIHFVTNDFELEEAINLLLSDFDYRKKLENGAKEYYNKFVNPKSVIQYILKSELVTKKIK